MTFDEWITIGLHEGFCGPPVCQTHDGTPMTHEETEEDDICIHIIRLYLDTEHKTSIERDHTPSQWRNLWKTGD
jgi:hypothetical protein